MSVETEAHTAGRPGTTAVTRPHTVPAFTPTAITGADNFQLLLDRHMRRHGQDGNAVRAEVHLRSVPDIDALEAALRVDPLLDMLCRLRVQRRFGHAARWVLAPAAGAVERVTVHGPMEARAFNERLLGRPMDLDGHGAHVDVVRRTDGGVTLVFSVHHVLVDRRGMLNVIHALDPEGPGVEGRLIAAPATMSFGRLFMNSVRTTAHMLSRPFWRLARLGPKDRARKSPAVFRTLDIDAALVDRAATAHGGVLHRSAFHLAATLVAARSIHLGRGERPPYFWVSRPVSLRPRGERGHVVGNALTFQYARVAWDDATDLHRCTRVIASQFKAQLVEGVTERYTSLLAIFRWLPLAYYSAMIDLAMGGYYASCSFSDLGEDPFEPRTFAGMPVEALIDHPSVPCPPGLTVVFSRRGARVQVTIGAVPEALQGGELDRFEQVLRQTLTHVPERDGRHR